MGWMEDAIIVWMNGLEERMEGGRGGWIWLVFIASSVIMSWLAHVAGPEVCYVIAALSRSRCGFVCEDTLFERGVHIFN
jgi:hypothetical protein